MGENSADAFKYNHLHRRFAEMTFRYEDEITKAAVLLQTQTQAAEQWKAEADNFRGIIVDRESEIARLKQLCNEAGVSYD